MCFSSLCAPGCQPSQLDEPGGVSHLSHCNDPEDGLCAAGSEILCTDNLSRRRGCQTTQFLDLESLVTSANCSGVALQAEAALAACSEALWTAIKQPARQRPTADEWFAGPFSDRLKAIQELALQRADPADTALAIETLQVSSGSLISCCMLASCLPRLL